MLLGNISEIVYDNTISVGQTKGVTDQDLALELRNYMANYQGTGDSDLNLGKTSQILKAQKKAFQSELKLKQSQEDSKKKETATQFLYLREETQELGKRIKVSEQQLAQLEQREKNLAEDAGWQEVLKKQISRRRKVSLVAAAVIVLLAAAVLFLPGLYRIGAAIVGVLALAGG